PPGRNSRQRPASQRMSPPDTPRRLRRAPPSAAAQSPPPGREAPACFVSPSCRLPGSISAGGAGRGYVLLVLGQGLAEHMLAVRAKNIVVIIGLSGLESGGDGGHARVVDGRRRQAGVLVEVVGTVQGGVVLLGDGPPGGIDQGRVDLEQAA